MDLLPLACQHCSAPLRVPESAKFVTCTHCGTQLAVRKTGGAAYTETLEAIDQRTERMAGQIDDLHRRTTLADLDRQWEADRERFYVTGKHGVKHLPTTGGSVAGGLFIMLIGGIWTAIACAVGGAAMSNAPGPFAIVGGLFPLFGVVFIAFGIWNAVSGFQKAKAYEEAERRYQQERESLITDE